MLSTILTGATIGLDTVPVEVQTDVSKVGLFKFNIVGLPDKAIDEAKERVTSAIRNSGASFPQHRITVNMAPADIRKVGPGYDLPLALGILLAHGEFSADVSNALFIGELGLDGSLRHTTGVLPLTLLAKQLGLTHIYLPAVDAPEASVVPDINVMPLQSLSQLIELLTSRAELNPHPYTHFSDILQSDTLAPFDFADIKGQEQAKRALEIVAAGHHNLMLHGVPGAGKTMLTRALPSIMPTLTETEALEVTKIYSITGNLPKSQSLITTRPFRSPHHTTSRIGLIGGGSYPAPGEISLAHRGVLFLDEIPEYPRDVLEALRQPLEDGIVTISRAAGTIQFPAQFLMVAAANPCPCGFHGSPNKQCTCHKSQIDRYQKKLSGPLLDRIDLHIQIAAVDVDKLTDLKAGETSAQIRTRVQAARDRQHARYQQTKLTANGDLNSQQVRKYCPLDDTCQDLLKTAVKQLGLSARSYFRLIKVARTIADLADQEHITQPHLAEALQYRAIISV